MADLFIRMDCGCIRYHNYINSQDGIVFADIVNKLKYIRTCGKCDGAAVRLCNLNTTNSNADTKIKQQEKLPCTEIQFHKGHWTKVYVNPCGCKALFFMYRVVDGRCDKESQTRAHKLASQMPIVCTKPGHHDLLIMIPLMDNTPVETIWRQLMLQDALPHPIFKYKLNEKRTLYCPTIITDELEI